MTLCKTLLAAYACAHQYGGQIAISTAPTVNATLVGAAGAQYTISIPVDMSLVYTRKIFLHPKALRPDRWRIFLNLVPLSLYKRHEEVDRADLRSENILSISNIETTGGTCTFCGVDGAEAVVKFPGPGSVSLDGVDVGPPQTIVFAVCT